MRDAPRGATPTQEFERRLRALEPRIRVVAPRVVRRVVRRTHDMGASAFHIPTRQVLIVGRDALLGHVAPRELSSSHGPGESASDVPETVYLVGRPDELALARLAREDFEYLLWRTVFEARALAALAARSLSGPEVRARLARLGQVEIDEIRAVLLAERRLLPPGTEHQLYQAFAGFYLELRFFEPAALSRYFPGLAVSAAKLASVDALIAEDVDARAIYQAARPAGLAVDRDGAWALAAGDDAARGADMPRRQPAARERSAAGLRDLLAEARAASRAGNDARAALQFSLARQVAPLDGEPAALAELERDTAAALASLGERLARTTDGHTAADEWRGALEPLLAPAGDGRWSQEARLVYDLQTACVEHQRARYKLDLSGWILGLGRRPFRRPLPDQQVVLAVKHLRSAQVRAASVHISADERRDLAALLARAEARLVAVLRARIEECLERTLDTVGLRAAHLPERVAREKLIDELVDRAIQRGFLAIGDVRDALSRNDLKLDDLGLAEFFGRDSLLATDRALARNLEGIYRPGEVYLRGLQRVSALTFGTRVGRALTRYVALPFGGAFVLLEGLSHMVGPILGLMGLPHPALVSRYSLLALGAVLLGLIHSSAFRAALVSAGRGVGTALHAVFVGAPRWLVSRPLLRRVLGTLVVRLVWRFVGIPGLFTALLCAGLARAPAGLDVSMHQLVLLGAAMFLASSALFNSRLGRDVEEIGMDAAVRAWHRIRWRIVPGLVRWVLEVFKSLLGGFEALLYRVDEWLRFRQGESRATLVFKAAFGSAWSVVTYIVRIYITLLVEPQVNPIKHFPVVTVSHKIILPFSLQLTALLSAPLTPLLGTVAASTVAGTTVFLLPGVFGFLVWEFKENWKLYSANRRPTVGPRAIGGHGEHMSQFMRPGFHSGTLPRLFSRLRRAERRGLYRGRWRRSQRLRVELHHVERAIAAFVTRELCTLLGHSKAFAASLSVGRIELSSNRIRVGLLRHAEEPPLYLVFEERSGWLLAGIASPGWLAEISPTQRDALRSGLLGLYKRAGVDILREQLDALLEPGSTYDVRADELIVWPADDFSVQVAYPGLASRVRARALQPTVSCTRADPPDAATFPSLELRALRFRDVPLPWPRWVAYWESEAPEPLLPDVRVLPVE